MRQAEKQAVVAARDLLKADANRPRRAAAVQTHKAAMSSVGRKLTQKRKAKEGAAPE